MQPLKIKSPLLLVAFLVGNIVTVFLLYLVVLNVELSQCTPTPCPTRTPAVRTAQVCGLLLVCLSEPFMLLSFLLRFIRIRKIFDAQQIYFEKSVRPSEMIQSYSERRLILILCASIGIFAGLYLATALIDWKVNVYGIIPTFAVG